MTTAGLPPTVRLKDTEEAWTVDLRTTASSIEENECDLCGSMSETGHPCTFPSLPTSVNLFVSLYLKWVSLRQHLAGSWLFFF